MLEMHTLLYIIYHIDWRGGDPSARVAMCPIFGINHWFGFGSWTLSLYICSKLIHIILD